MLTFYRSTVGKKAIMAVTGLIGVGYVLVHIAGNLQAFAGRDKLNAYAALLHGPAAELTLAVRVLLVVSVILHALMAWQLTLRARAARPTGYGERDPQASTWAARTMRWGGVLLLAFIAFHLRHFTTRTIDPAGWAHRFDAAGRYDIYGNVVNSFRIPWVSAVYLIAMVILGYHLWHGVWSFGRSLGVSPASPTPMQRRVALVVALAIWIGFSVIPLAVMLGVLR
jgi:succinate dehydrogenase / fumarate reductase cytochrome b subunit